MRGAGQARRGAAAPAPGSAPAGTGPRSHHSRRAGRTRRTGRRLVVASAAAEAGIVAAAVVRGTDARAVEGVLRRAVAGPAVRHAPAGIAVRRALAAAARVRPAGEHVRAAAGGAGTVVGGAAGARREAEAACAAPLKIFAGIVVGGFALLVAIGFVGSALDDHRASGTINGYVHGDPGVQYDSAAGGYRARVPDAPGAAGADVPGRQRRRRRRPRPDQPARPAVCVRGRLHRPHERDLVLRPEAALAGVVDAMAGAVDGKVTETTPATLQGLAAEDFVMSFKDNGDDAYAIGRVALSSQRLYLVAVTAWKAERDGFQRLVDSFQLTSSLH